MDDNFGGWMKILSFVFLLTFYALAQFGGNSAPRWGGNSAPAWGGNPAASTPTCEWVVTSTDDAGAGTLRQMIADASAGDTICFDEFLAGQTIHLDSSLVISSKNLSFIGFGTNKVIISADSAFGQIFNISNSDVLLRGLRITKGNTTIVSGGAAIKHNSGDLVIDSCIVDSNYAHGTTMWGGIIAHWNNGITSTYDTVSISNLVFAYNRTTASTITTVEGGLTFYSSSSKSTKITINNSAFIYNIASTTSPSGAHPVLYSKTTGGGQNDLYMSNCTISNNTYFRVAYSVYAFRVMVIDFCTIANNSGTSGGGGLLGDGVTDTLRNCIIANNFGTDVAGTITYVDYSLIKSYSATISTDGGHNILDGTDPGLNALIFESNTWVRPIDSGDPVYNTGDCTIGQGGDVDQRGVSRPQSTECDMGAYEVE